MRGEHVGHLLVGEIDLVVGEHRAALDLGPAAFAAQAIDALRAGDGVAKARGARVDVVGRDVAELQADRAAVRLQLLQVLRHQHAHLVVVGAEIGRAQLAILLEQIGVDGHHRDVRLPLAQQVGGERRVRGRDRDRGDAPGQQVVDDLDLAGLVGARRRAGVQALVLGVRVLRLPLLAAQVDLLEERIVEPLDDDRQRLLVLGRSRSGNDQYCAGSQQEQFSHDYLPEKTSAAILRDAASVRSIATRALLPPARRECFLTRSSGWSGCGRTAPRG